MTTPMFRKGDAVSIAGVVEYVSGTGELSVRTGGQTIYVYESAARVTLPVFAVGDDVRFDTLTATGFRSGKVIAVADPFLWIDERNGSKPATVPIRQAERIPTIELPEPPPSPSQD